MVRRQVAALVIAVVASGCGRGGDGAGMSGARPATKAPPVETPGEAAPPAAEGFRCAVLVRSSGGAPRPGTRVDMVREDGVVVASEVADEKGIARFRVRAGSYTVRMRDGEGAVLAEVGYEISGDAPAPIEVVLGNR